MGLRGGVSWGRREEGMEMGTGGGVGDYGRIWWAWN